MLESFQAIRMLPTNHSESLDRAFSTRPNSLNVLRLCLAASVIFSHAWHIGGFGPEPQFFGIGLGAWAVLAFFGISGYLITTSRLANTSTLRYFRARILRIVPGLWVSVVLVAFAIAPVSAFLSDRNYSLGDAVRFAVHNGLLLAAPPVSGPIGGSLAGLPDAQLWNAPLWTLFWEAFCYVIVGLLGAFLRPRLFTSAVLILLVLGTAGLWMASQSQEVSYWVVNCPLAPLTAFFAGSTISCFRDRIPFSARNLILAAILAGSILATGQGYYLVFVPFVSIILMLSLLMPLKRMGGHHDVSYGMYIYGWPVQQCLAMSGLESVAGPVMFGIASLLATFPIAWLSWLLVERPAQRLGKTKVGDARERGSVQRTHVKEMPA